MFKISKIGGSAITNYILLLLISISLSCTNTNNEAEAKNEIMQAEKDFQQLLVSEGVAAAFYKFASDSAVIKRENDTLIIGREGIKNYYSNPFYKNAIAVWAPDFIEVSIDGTMGYTFGKYEWTFTDSTGIKTNYKGVFHTVWKKMPEGSWKYVWD
jgi:ketosteroid isomerase-like protein